MKIPATPNLDSVSILLLFLMAAIMAIFCISLLVIIIRKSITFRSISVYRVFFHIAFYIASRLVICGILI